MSAFYRRLFRANALAMLLAVAPSAHAYCRSSTCSGECPRDDRGCKTTGFALYWKSRCIGFSLQQDGSQWLAKDDVREAVHASFLAWTNLDCGVGVNSLRFRELSEVACHDAEYNPSEPNANVIIFQDTKWKYTSAHNNVAKTIVTFDDETGEILDADIEVNQANNGFTVKANSENCNYAHPDLRCDSENDCFDLQSVLTHEVGHFLGLDHSLEGEATMNEAYQQGTTCLRSLEPDDALGACKIYPPGREAVCDATPKNGFSVDCQNEAEEGCGCKTATNARDGERWGAAALALLACVAFRRRGRRTRRRE